MRLLNEPVNQGYYFQIPSVVVFGLTFLLFYAALDTLFGKGRDNCSCQRTLSPVDIAYPLSGKVQSYRR